MIFALCISVRAESAKWQITIGAKASAMERYAARELQRYLYQLSGTLLEIKEAEITGKPPSGFILGQRSTNRLIESLLPQGQAGSSAPGPQGYILKKISSASAAGADALYIAGADETGVLYGVYGLLGDHYGIGFYFSGDVLPDRKQSLTLPDVDECITPAAHVRGFLPWTNFPQSATSYSWEDWRYIIDQMARMRMNFIHVHNYSGDGRHNEMFANFAYKGFMSRVWMATARSGHGWACPGWAPGEYRFGAADLFDDYDFGADCALHNETLTNEQVFRKGASEFQKVIAYAHTRGVRIGLGLDINTIPAEYKADAGDPEVVKARVAQITGDYPDLDYLLCFQSEGIPGNPALREKWRRIFDAFHDEIAQKKLPTRMAVAGWGIAAADVATLPSDVICAPISRYSDGCESGAIYGEREYWGCPWLERDFNSSEYYYPYNMHLSNTVKAWQSRAPNMKGFYCLTWRLTDAIDPKIAYIAKTPWDAANKYKDAEAAYREYAERHYGKTAAEKITPIINENEPLACLTAECQGTAQFNEVASRGGYLFNVNYLKIAPERPKAKVIEAERFAKAGGGVRRAPCSEGGQCIGFIRSGDWARYDDVDFGNGAESIEYSIAAPSEKGSIELHLDSLTGPVIGKLPVDVTGEWQIWKKKQAAISPTSGRHKLFTKFLGLPADGSGELKKAEEQLKTIDACIAQAQSPTHKRYLQLLRCRIAAARDHIILNRDFEKYEWKDLPGAVESWAKNFIYLVCDISSLGNVMSTQNRYMQLNYVKKELSLYAKLDPRPPQNVKASETGDGASIQWDYDLPVKGFNVYRDSVKINKQPLSAGDRILEDKERGAFHYTVTAIDGHGRESLPSMPAFIITAGTDKTPPPHVIMVSPPTSAPEGEPVWIKVRLVDDSVPSLLQATLRYRTPGAAEWKMLRMNRRAGKVYTTVIPGEDVGPAGIEYAVFASNDRGSSSYPPAGQAMPLSLTAYPLPKGGRPGVPQNLHVENARLAWNTPNTGKPFWYRIYRASRPEYLDSPDPFAFLTYVAGDTTSVLDNFAGNPKDTLYYCVTAVDKEGRESAPTKAIDVSVADLKSALEVPGAFIANESFLQAPRKLKN